jgi:hypothetical protein
MQTFMTKLNFRDTAKELDDKRLNKQALEGWQILMNLLAVDPQGNHRTPKGWSNHPAVKMWRGHEFSLALYVVAMCDEWIERGHNTVVRQKVEDTMRHAVALDKPIGETPPPWYQDLNTLGSVARSHRLALLSKNYDWYKQFKWAEDTGVPPETYEYVWPVK